MTKQSIEYRFFKKFAPQINGIIVPPDAVGEFGWEGHFDIKPQDGIDFIKQEITKALQIYSQEMDEVIGEDFNGKEYPYGEDGWQDDGEDTTTYAQDCINEVKASQRQEKLEIDKKWGIKK